MRFYIHLRALRLVRLIGLLTILAQPLGCAYCVDTSIHPEAVMHNDYCAQYVGEGKLDEAESRCRLAIEYSPKFAEPYNQLGLIELQRGHEESARDFFKQAISMRGDFAEAHNNLGYIFMQRRQYGAACDAFRGAIEVDPGFVNARVNLGHCLRLSKHLNEARDEYLKCLELDANLCDCRLGVGGIDLADERWEDARASFAAAVRACPDDANAHYNLCWTNYQLGDFAAAVSECNITLALNPQYIEAKKMLAEAQKQLELSDKAGESPQ